MAYKSVPTPDRLAASYINLRAPARLISGIAKRSYLPLPRGTPLQTKATRAAQNAPGGKQMPLSLVRAEVSSERRVWRICQSSNSRTGGKCVEQRLDELRKTIRSDGAFLGSPRRRSNCPEPPDQRPPSPLCEIGRSCSKFSGSGTSTPCAGNGFCVRAIGPGLITNIRSPTSKRSRCFRLKLDPPSVRCRSYVYSL